MENVSRYGFIKSVLGLETAAPGRMLNMSTIVSRAETTIRAYGAQAYYAMKSSKCRVYIGWNARHKAQRAEDRQR